MSTVKSAMERFMRGACKCAPSYPSFREVPGRSIFPADAVEEFLALPVDHLRDAEKNAISGKSRGGEDFVAQLVLGFDRQLRRVGLDDEGGAVFARDEKVITRKHRRSVEDAAKT